MPPYAAAWVPDSRQRAACDMICNHIRRASGARTQVRLWQELAGGAHVHPRAVRLDEKAVVLVQDLEMADPPPEHLSSTEALGPL